jgi:phospholipase/carboxylesterase
MKAETFGPLRVYLAGGTDGLGGGTGPLVVLMHGFGASGTDLVDLASVFRLPQAHRFAFPEAPLELDWGGRAWWMLDMELFERRARGERVDRTEEVPPRLSEARAELSVCLGQLYAQLGVSPERTVLGGFSQGSMLACDFALHAETKPGALALLSSTLIARSQWEPRMASLAGMPVTQTHGRYDDILPFQDAERLAELLRAGGADLNFEAFDGAHEIPPPALRALARVLTKVS